MYEEYARTFRPKRYVVVPPPSIGPDFPAFDDQGRLRVVVHDTPGPNHYRRYLFPRDVDFRLMSQVGNKLKSHELVKDIELGTHLISIRLGYKRVLDRFHSAQLSDLVQAGLAPLQIVFVPYKDVKQFVRRATGV